MSDLSLCTEADLLVRLAGDDPNAFSEIYRRQWESLYNGAYKRLGDDDQCKDVLQNVFSDLWERRKQGLNIVNLSAYLHTAVRFQVIKLITRHPNHSTFLDTFDLLLTSPLQPDEPLLEKEILDLVKFWIDALPEKRRAIFLMRHYEDMSTSQIADSLGISVKTVQNQLNSAGSILRERLSKILALQSLLTFIYFR